jgi:cyclophilin family peptidyl-prolyl cis-trans isomerase
VIQGGDPYSRDRDPSNDGRGGMTVPVEDERSEAPFLRGVVAMANQGRPNSSGSQLFIMHAENRALDGRYNVIGRVRTGMEVVDAITEVEIDTVARWGPQGRPFENVVMERVRALEPGSGPEPSTQVAQDSTQAAQDEIAATGD